MTEKWLSGEFKWYNTPSGYGVILGNDGQEYFAHKTNHPVDLIPKQGLRVKFKARFRHSSKQGMEAFDIQLDSSPETKPKTELTKKEQVQRTPQQPEVKRLIPPPHPSEAKSTISDINQVAEEALRLKRERKLGMVPEPVEHLAPGTRIQHPIYGRGVVELVSQNIVSVWFGRSEGVIDLPRSEVTPVAFESQSPFWPKKDVRKPPKEQESLEYKPLQSTIGEYIKHLANDVHITLQSEGWENSKIYFYEEPASSIDKPQPLEIDARVAHAFHKTSSITNFYSHQSQTRRALVAGKNIILSTPTASGKTEAYNPTILETLLQNAHSTALYIFPLVALGFDQAERLEKLNKSLPYSDQLNIGIYNNSVPPLEKIQMLKADNRIVVTTPDSLHYVFLPKPYPNWRRFYQNLRYIVLDEAHLYKGVFGTNMANIVRRLLVRCRREGNPQFPQVIIASATVRHPEQLAHQLTGLPKEVFEVIDKSGAPTPGRHFLTTRSDIHDLETLCAELLDVTTHDLLTDEKRPVRTIVFLRSIKEVKQSAERIRQHLRKTGRVHQFSQVEAYYSEKLNRSDTLIRLRNGDIRCLFTTTALMAGIDIGGLDVAIVKNFPRLVMDARQMFGRAGRMREGAAIFIGNRNDPFDQFYFERPDHLFNGPTEDVIANPENPFLLAAHLMCAAQTSPVPYKTEGPLSGRWVDLFGQMGSDLLNSLVKSGGLRIQGGNYHLDIGEPHDQEPLNNIRSMQSVTYTLVNTADSNEMLEEKRETTAFRDAHPGAIVWINGEYFRVIKLDQNTRQISCSPDSESNLRTQGVEQREIEILSIDQDVSRNGSPQLGGGVNVWSGRVKITNTVSKYRVYKSQTVMQCRNRPCRYESPHLETKRCPKCDSSVRAKQIEKVLEEHTLSENPPLSTVLQTRSSWLDIPLALKKRYEKEFWPRWSIEDEKTSDLTPIAPSFEYAIHSVEHAILKAFPERIRCDRDEIGEVYQTNLEKIAARIFIYDNFPGGLGLANDFADDPHFIIEGALEIIERCTCADDEGCPVCLTNFGCHSFNGLLSKLAGRYLLYILLGKDPKPVIKALEEFVLIQFPPSSIVRGSEIPNNS